MTILRNLALLAGLLLGAGHALADGFPVPTDGQFELIRFPNGYGCGLYAEITAQKGSGWFVSGTAPAREAECRKSCEAQVSVAQAEYRGKRMAVAGTCFHGRKALYTTSLAQ